LLKMLSFTKTEQTLQDLKKLLRDFYIQRVENEVDQYQIDDQILNEHLRTPYR
jgi:predicted outer membrane protein